MREEKNTRRSMVHIGFDGRVHKVFRGPKASERFATEVRVLNYLEERGCDFVPRLLYSDPAELKIVTTNCGSKVDLLSDSRTAKLFEELESYGVRHEDPFLRNVTYRASDGRFCIIDFEFATILDESNDAGVVCAAGAVPTGDTVVSGVEWSCRTDIGLFRSNNEDAFVALSLNSEGAPLLGQEGKDSLGSSDFIFAVSDGMGGARSGEFASRIAVERITGLLPGYFRSGVGAEKGERLVMNELFEIIHADIGLLGSSYPECRGMGTTLSLCWVMPGRMLVAHVGDSRVYRWRGGEENALRQLTDDDTRVAALLRAGKISEYEARNHPARNMLSKALGAGNQYVVPQVETVELEAGDRFLICSDGVTDGIWESGMMRLMSDGANAAQIVEHAVAQSGRDNATAIVFQID
ncbi:MAG: protein phosphatase 2C domain-containing protein [Verrucomicrobiota bacterium]|nr:protein phosphatase 2C domain-containing protein [Verrucomicrobiota bacterium]